MKIGVDIGNSTTCTSEGILFDSKVSKSNQYLSEDGKIILNNETFYIEQGNFDSEYRKVRKQNYIRLLFGALSKSIEEKVSEVELGLGLPLIQYKEDKNALNELIMKNRIMEGNFEGTDRKFYITNVKVYPEAALSTPLGYEGIVIDIGGRTTDLCIIEQVGGRKKILKPSSIPNGIINLQTNVISAVNSKLGLNLTIDDFSKIIKNGLKIYGVQQDLEFVRKIMKDWLESLLFDIDQEYNFKINQSIFCGGGSILLKKPILKRVQGTTVVDDIFCNANAYKIMLEANL
ncbi:ParM/StbA family protein [uncultured Clostridium sp.]|uniref:ParM/StbA family protein n=1 Tax=uncultured Clostridium sp. TaxID=59620 RepID=UPI00262D7432|nr:ParM/StbA family protein [uncultured Clostridium sp.]